SRLLFNCSFLYVHVTLWCYSLSLHDALPISCRPEDDVLPPQPRGLQYREGNGAGEEGGPRYRSRSRACSRSRRGTAREVHRRARSEEHTSELQSRENLVCRLLLEKKKNTILH